MKEINGQYTTAKVFTDDIEESAINQIKELCNQEFVENCKIRIMPDVHAGSGCVIGFTANLGNKVIPNIVGVDIGCLDKDTEFLTSNGWKKIDEYVEGDDVLQYNKNTDIASFVKPINYIVKDCNEFYHLKNNKGLDQMLSKEHKILVWKGYKSRGYKLQDMNPLEIISLGDSLNKGYYGIKASFNIDNKGVDLSDNEIRLDIMIAADGCIRYEKDNLNKIELHFSKNRKVDRARKILNLCNIKYSEKIGKNDTTYFYFNVNKSINKDLSKYWKANIKQLKIITEECLLWDGHNGYRSYYTSTNKINSDIIQFAFASTNIRAGISIVKSNKENWNDNYIVTPTKNNIINITNTITKVKSLDGKKYCFTVPSGYFIARRNGKIFITGNCGMLVVNLGKINLNLRQLDEIIYNYIPSGREVHESRIVKFPSVQKLYCYRELKDTKRIERSIGTLGGKQNFCHLH